MRDLRLQFVYINVWVSKLKHYQTRCKGWHAECNSAAKSVLTCDGTQIKFLVI